MEQNNLERHIRWIIIFAHRSFTSAFKVPKVDFAKKVNDKKRNYTATMQFEYKIVGKFKNI